ncbi:hypothetical protein NEHOM01_1027 [Nematocida homosporus]|uniref:uncharacterized protein n=1 Tax=Nematocida homosporus TaxID=1912981 RepID=UPI0022207854|nr:uncharacterized protein NEHOM01_1027 [Nematocida homosporus]KAI5185735.1 hypothetical protein NEHOM01_1027 [Nematocida homosporus]
MDRSSVLVEALVGLSACFVYLTETQYSERLAEIDSLLKEAHKIYKTKQRVIIRLERIFTCPGMVSEPVVNAGFEDKMGEVLKSFGCKCGCSWVESESILRLPSGGWEELIDMWSCHDREFKHFADKKLVPRTRGLLYGPLHLVLGRERVPKCLVAESGGDGVVCYSALSLGIGDEFLLFHYLYERFQRESSIVVVGEQKMTLSLLDTTYVVRGELSSVFASPKPILALKVAYTLMETGRKEDLEVSAYFATKLLDILQQNTVAESSEIGTIAFILANDS